MANNENVLKIGGTLTPETTDTPVDSRCVINTLSEMYDISLPYEGMIVYCKEDKNHYKVLGLKSKQVGPLVVPDAAVNGYALLSDAKADSNLTDKDFIFLQRAALDTLAPQEPTGDQWEPYYSRNSHVCDAFYEAVKGMPVIVVDGDVQYRAQIGVVNNYTYTVSFTDLSGEDITYEVAWGTGDHPSISKNWNVQVTLPAPHIAATRFFLPNWETRIADGIIIIGEEPGSTPCLRVSYSDGSSKQIRINPGTYEVPEGHGICMDTNQVSPTNLGMYPLAMIEARSDFALLALNLGSFFAIADTAACATWVETKTKAAKKPVYLYGYALGTLNAEDSNWGEYYSTTKTAMDDLIDACVNGRPVFVVNSPVNTEAARKQGCRLCQTAIREDNGGEYYFVTLEEMKDMFSLTPTQTYRLGINSQSGNTSITKYDTDASILVEYSDIYRESSYSRPYLNGIIAQIAANPQRKVMIHFGENTQLTTYQSGGYITTMDVTAPLIVTAGFDPNNSSIGTVYFLSASHIAYTWGMVSSYMSISVDLYNGVVNVWME